MSEDEYINVIIERLKKLNKHDLKIMLQLLDDTIKDRKRYEEPLNSGNILSDKQLKQKLIDQHVTVNE
jgi:hypothetical protein